MDQIQWRAVQRKNMRDKEENEKNVGKCCNDNLSRCMPSPSFISINKWG